MGFKTMNAHGVPQQALRNVGRAKRLPLKQAYTTDITNGVIKQTMRAGPTVRVPLSQCAASVSNAEQEHQRLKALLVANKLKQTFKTEIFCY